MNNRALYPSKKEAQNTVSGRSIYTIQPKLAINQPGDFHEREADRVADQVMGMKAGDAPVSQQMALTPVSSVQRHEAGTSSGAKMAPPAVSNVLSSGGGQPMDTGTRQFMESRFGQDFSNVRIHTDDRAASSAQSIHALAYTSGNQVVFGQGAYSPGTEGGRRLLAHELAHVGQQGGTPIKRQSAPFRGRGTGRPIRMPGQPRWVDVAIIAANPALAPIILPLVPLTSRYDVTVGIGPVLSVSGVVGGGFGGGVVVSRGRVGLYGFLQSQLGVTVGADFAAQVTVLGGGISNFEGECVGFNVGGSIPIISMGGHVTFLYNRNNQFLGMSGDFGFMPGLTIIEFYMSYQNTMSTLPTDGQNPIIKTPKDIDMNHSR